jgi:hypothetical protein
MPVVGGPTLIGTWVGRARWYAGSWGRRKKIMLVAIRPIALARAVRLKTKSVAKSAMIGWLRKPRKGEAKTAIMSRPAIPIVERKSRRENQVL